ncbi:MAG: dTDP-glucose pyrophosphorylase [Nitrospirae bacterium]|nr:dTDP-glucose pyrophosphorylase [Nitrospirota bacterium]
MNHYLQNGNNHRKVIGLIPAGGKASRLSRLPCSKELLPVGFLNNEQNNGPQLKVISHYLLERMRLANITRAYIVLREGKWDIPAYFGNGKIVDMHLSYLMMDSQTGIPYTLDQAFHFVEDAIIALGFPDSIFHPDHAFEKLLIKQSESKADIVLGLFPAPKPHKTDMVDMDDSGRIRSIQIKPDHTYLVYAWEIAVWTPAFTRYMHEYLLTRQGNNNHQDHEKELYISDVIQSAMLDDMKVDSVLFEDGSCLDIGTPEDLFSAVRITSEMPEGFLKQ